MKTYKAYANEKLIADNVALADTFMTRLNGLMKRKTLYDEEGLFLKNCSSIHCFFMHFTIDAVYLDKNMRVVAKETVRPWRLGGIYKGARHVLEIKEGASDIINKGDEIIIKEI